MALSNVGYSVAGVDITVTATSDVDCSAGVYGVEITINDIPAFSVDEVGAAANQTITVGAAEGVQVGDIVKLDPYYNLDPFGAGVRVYGTQVTVNLGTVTPSPNVPRAGMKIWTHAR